MPGGVCAVLDYEVEEMAEYVADMATRIVTPDAKITSAFRKFVSQILTSTRLPSTTILLGLNYLAKRVNTLTSQGQYKASEGQVWRYLTVSLLLGSKFLDDNTFQNRSWSEVSGIAVAELNSLEFEWVAAMSWRLYVNLDHSEDYQAWLGNWRDWQANKKREAARASRERIASLVPAIDTEVARYSNYGRQNLSPHSKFMAAQTAEYERLSDAKVRLDDYRARENAWRQQQQSWNAPLTPPDSGYGTPDYGMSATSINSRYNDWFAQASAQQYGYDNSKYYRSSFDRNSNKSFNNQYHCAWEHGLAECSCQSCIGPMKQGPFFVPSNYGQAVMG